MANRQMAAKAARSRAETIALAKAADRSFMLPNKSTLRQDTDEIMRWADICGVASVVEHKVRTVVDGEVKTITHRTMATCTGKPAKARGLPRQEMRARSGDEISSRRWRMAG